MRSYKNWKLVNESVIPGRNLGISTPQSLGLQSNVPLSEKKGVPEDEKKKCCCKNMKKHMKDELEEPHDDEDDVNSVEVPGDEESPEEKDIVGDEEESEEETGEEEIGDEEVGDEEEEEDDGGEDAVKFGFMKDKKAKKKKMEEQFWQDISNYNVPKEAGESDEEFFGSLSRQYGDPHLRHHGGVDKVEDQVNEDLLLSPDQEALIAAMPNPGDPGYAPQGRLGGGFMASGDVGLDTFPYGEADESDYQVLRKYLSESVARDLINKKK